MVDKVRWNGITRPYTQKDVVSLRGSIKVEYSLAKLGSQKLWTLLHKEPYVLSFGALSGNQAIQQVQAGFKAIYVSGWQVAADQNEAYQMYPDLSLYPANSTPILVKRINHSLQRADQIEFLKKDKPKTDWLVPIVADAESGFGGPLNIFEITKAMIESGAAAVHFEDQLSSAKKCGHLGGKVIIPINEFIQKLIAARLAADVLDVPTILIARTDSCNAKYLTNDIDERDKKYLVGKRTKEGYYSIRNGIEIAIERAIAYAPYADMIWYETDYPDIKEAEKFARAIHKVYPNKLLGYNCSPSFNWTKIDKSDVKNFNENLGKLGYKFQFVTLAGFHSLNSHMFELSKEFQEKGMSAYEKLQSKEFEQQKQGYKAIKQQEFVGVGYYDKIVEIVSQNTSSITALNESTEKEQF